MAEPDTEPGYETRDVSARGVGCFGLGLAIGTAIIMVLVAAMFARLGEHFPGTAASRITTGRNQAPSPQLQGYPAGEMERFRQQENETLNSYGWVDRQAGVARIPIERAMDLLVQRGLPAPGGAGKTPIEMRQEKAEAQP